MDVDTHKAVKPPPSALKAIDTYAFEVLLKRVARSFQLSLRILPASIRSTLSLAYMLARASDSIADASSAPEFQRLALLRALPDFYPEKSPDLGLTGYEKDLVQRLPELLEVLQSMPDAAAIIEAWRVILRGQIFDLERFCSTESGDPSPPLSPEELDEYTYLVAGSVGEFWTRLCCQHIPGYSSKTLEQLLPAARRFGQALQLVNILRDRRTDADMGRVYIPDQRFYAEMEHVGELLTAGDEYTASVLPRMLRAACLLPLYLARRTLALVAEHPLGERVKVPRYIVWGALIRAILR